MSNNTHAVADHASETYPAFSGKIQDTYIKGYDPVSWAAPHSSLLRTSTWVGMGLVMSILPAIGILTFGFGRMLYGHGTAPESHTKVLLIVGAIMLVVIAVAAVASIRHGRRFYRQYRAETGRVN